MRDERVEEIRKRRIPGNSLTENPTHWPCEDVTYLLAALDELTAQLKPPSRAYRKAPWNSDL